MKRVQLSAVRNDLGRYLRQAKKQGLLLTKRGKPVGVLIGFAGENDWLDYLLENDPAFLDKIAKAREDLRSGKGTRLENLE
jgi:prevent-host-death family protein